MVGNFAEKDVRWCSRRGCSGGRATGSVVRKRPAATGTVALQPAQHPSLGAQSRDDRRKLINFLNGDVPTPLFEMVQVQL